MDAQHYYVDKTSDTQADTLLAVGLHHLLRSIAKSKQPSRHLDTGCGPLLRDTIAIP